MLWRKNDATLDFDFQKAVEATKDNPVFYIQYAHARICSVLRHCQNIFGDLNPLNAQLDLLEKEEDIALIKVLAMWPRIVDIAAQAQEPHRIAYYLYDVAGTFHALWNKGKEQTILRFIHSDDRALTQSKLALLLATAIIIRAGLNIMGVEAPEEMTS